MNIVHALWYRVLYLRQPKYVLQLARVFWELRSLDATLVRLEKGGGDGNGNA